MRHICKNACCVSLCVTGSLSDAASLASNCCCFTSHDTASRGELHPFGSYRFLASRNQRPFQHQALSTTFHFWQFFRRVWESRTQTMERRWMARWDWGRKHWRWATCEAHLPHFTSNGASNKRRGCPSCPPRGRTRSPLGFRPGPGPAREP